MSSIDFSEYVDLTINDKPAPQVYQDAVEYGKRTFPELNPRPGTLEDALLQSFASIGSQVMGAINRLPDGLMEGILRLHGLTRFAATFSEIELSFTLSTAGQTVPAGTAVIFNYDAGDQLEQYVFITTTSVTATSSATTVSTFAKSIIAGPIPNIVTNDPFVIAEPSSVILSAVAGGNITQGEMAETSTEYLSRGVTYLQSLSRVLTTALQIENYILTTYRDVKRCHVYDLVKPITFEPTSPSATNLTRSGTAVAVTTNSTFVTASTSDSNFRILTPEFYGDDTYTQFKSGTYSGTFSSGNNLNVTGVISGTGSSGPAKVINLDKFNLSTIASTPVPGFFGIFICGSNGTPVSDELKNNIYSDIQGKIVAGLEFEILDVWVYDLKFNVSISVDASYVGADVATDVATTISTEISPNNWAVWDSTVRLFDIVVSASKVAGVQYVYSVDQVSIAYPDTSPGNSSLYNTLSSGGSLVGLTPIYAGLLPRVSTVVTVA